LTRSPGDHLRSDKGLRHGVPGRVDDHLPIGF